METKKELKQQLIEERAAALAAFFTNEIEKRGLTAAALARLLGCADGTIRRLMSLNLWAGRHKTSIPSVRLVTEALQALNASPEEIKFTVANVRLQRVSLGMSADGRSYPLGVKKHCGKPKMAQEAKAPENKILPLVPAVLSVALVVLLLITILAAR